MKLIPLTQGKFAQVDDEDYDYLMQWKWYTKKGRNTFYAVRSIFTRTKEGKKSSKRVYMHRDLLNIQDSNILVDHIDCNGLNNQSNNIRECTMKQNQANSGAKKRFIFYL